MEKKVVRFVLNNKMIHVICLRVKYLQWFFFKLMYYAFDKEKRIDKIK